MAHVAPRLRPALVAYLERNRSAYSCARTRHTCGRRLAILESTSDLGKVQVPLNTISIWHPVVCPPAAARRVRLLDEPEARQEAEPGRHSG